MQVLGVVAFLVVLVAVGRGGSAGTPLRRLGEASGAGTCSSYSPRWWRSLSASPC
ncbi:MAG: hypothetical protein M3211_07350 [Actinomycetota bacterium]|nr:hypothetical protein [Actinomycetota bacterium]